MPYSSSTALLNRTSECRAIARSPIAAFAAHTTRRSLQRSTWPGAEKPHEMGDPEPIVVHVAILEVACHAGGRGFESRRSRPEKILQIGHLRVPIS